MIKRGRNKKILPKKDYSNLVVALVLIATIFCSIAGTLIVLESISSIENTVLVVRSDDSGKALVTLPSASAPKSIPVEPVSSQGKLNLKIQN